MEKMQRPRNQSRLALVGQVKDALTHQGIGAARVKIKAAPKKFLEQLLGKLKFAESVPHSPAMVWPGKGHSLIWNNRNPQTLTDQALNTLKIIVQKPPSSPTDPFKLWLHESGKIKPQSYR
jgi:hypothetical protein